MKALSIEIFYGAKKLCSHVWLLLRRKWTDLDEIWSTVSTLLGVGPGSFLAVATVWEAAEILFVFLSGK